MWSFAFVGPTLLVLGLLSFVLPIDGLSMHGRPVTTASDKLLWVAETAVVSAGGIWFVLWHVRQTRLDRLMPFCPTCNRRVHPDTMGLCDTCSRQVAPAMHLGERENRERVRAVLVFIGMMTVVGLLTQVQPMRQRMRPGYGQWFRTVILVVDADDGAALQPVISSYSSRRSNGPQYNFGVAGGARVNWRYLGEPLPLEVSAKGYDAATVELKPESPTTMTVRLKRKRP